MSAHTPLHDILRPIVRVKVDEGRAHALPIGRRGPNVALPPKPQRSALRRRRARDRRRGRHSTARPDKLLDEVFDIATRGR